MRKKGVINTKRISVVIPKGLLSRIDDLAKKNLTNRNAWITNALVKKAKFVRVDKQTFKDKGFTEQESIKLQNIYSISIKNKDGEVNG